VPIEHRGRLDPYAKQINRVFVLIINLRGTRSIRLLRIRDSLKIDVTG